MRREIIAHVEHGGTGLTSTASAAVRLLASSAPDVSARARPS
jgi:hypothetical protein